MISASLIADCLVKSFRGSFSEFTLDAQSTIKLIKASAHRLFLHKKRLIMISMQIYVVLALTCLAGVLASSDLIMKPTSEGPKGSVAFLLAPGFGIGAASYEPLGLEIQKQMAEQGLSVYFGVPHMPGNITMLGLKKALKRVAGEMTDAGLEADHATFYSGHSVGGALMPYILKDLKNLAEGFDKPDGLVLMASFLVRILMNFYGLLVYASIAIFNTEWFVWNVSCSSIMY